MRIIRRILWFVVLVAGAWYLYSTVFQPTQKEMVGQAVKSYGAPFKLIDHNGAPIDEQAIVGNPAAVFFGFTHCPEVCPTTLFELDAWLEAVGEEGNHINAFFISVDPERDTAQIMKTYVGNFSDRVIGITGDTAKITALAKSWHVYVKKVPLEEDDYTVDHTATTFLLNADGSLFGTIAYGENSDTATSKLKRLAKNN